MQIADIWLRDLPQQFQGKERIEALISAFAKQIEELHRVFKQLDLEIDLDTATGKNLDLVGSIASLTRKEAQFILRKTDTTELGDELYRAVLRYKILKNTCGCTYEDVVNSICMLWKVNYISYTEPQDRPATICIGLPTFDIDIDDPAAERTLAIKAAGVKLIYIVRYGYTIDSNTETIRLRNIRFHVPVSFWNVKTYNGTFFYGGTFLYDSKRRYWLGLGLKHTHKIYNYEASIDNLTVVTKYRPYFYDGSVKYDGSRKYGSLYRREDIE